jgi:two-component system, NarL family, response regulator NreC
VFGDVIRVILADDHAVVRAGLKTVLSSARDITVMSEASTGREAVALADRYKPDIVVMDLVMPDTDGVEATRQIVANGSAKVLVLTMHTEDEHLAAALSAGASGYLVKSAAERELVDAVRAVARGDVYVQPAVVRVVAQRLERTERVATDRARLERLTDREREVLRLVAEGYGAPDIGDRLSISAKTVDTYRRRINEKLGISQRPEYVRFALRVGMLSLETTEGSGRPR